MRFAEVLVAVSVGAAGVTLLAHSSHGQTAQQPTQRPVFRTSADVVPLTVAVLDRRGVPVTDLTAADFTVYENGIPRELLNFSTQTMAAGKAGSDATPPATPGNRGAQRRRFVIVLGFGRIQYPGKGIDGALSFVRDRLLPDDALAIAAFHRTTAFTTDHRAILSILERYRQHHERIVWEIQEYFRRTRSPFSRGGPPLPADMLSRIDADLFGGVAPGGNDRSSARLGLRNTVDLLLGMDRATQVADKPWQRQQSFGQLVSRLDGAGWSLGDVTVMSSRLKLFAGIEHLRGLDGEKHVVVIAQDPIAATADTARTLARRAAGARVTVDYVWTRGTNIRGGSGCDPCRDVSELTGGLYTSLDYADQALARIDQATRFAYLLGYAPLAPTLDAKYRDIDVKVNRPDVIVRFAHGYYASVEAEAAEMVELVREARVEAALALPETATDIPIVVAADQVPSRNVLRVQISVDASALALVPENGLRTGRLEVQVHCGDARQTVIGSLTQRLDLKATPETYATWLKDGFRHVVDVPITGTPRFVKAVVYDFGADRAGSSVLTIGRQ